MSGRLEEEEGYLSNPIPLLVGVVLISLAMYTLVITPSYFSGQASSASLHSLTDSLALSGSVTGYADLRAGSENNPSRPAPAGSTGMNGVRLNLKLASLRLEWQAGTGDDLSRATVIVTTPKGSETIPRQFSSPFPRPGWSIVSKNGLLPGTDADRDEILEPNEVFSIVIIPSENLPPGTPFTITIAIPNVQPLTIERVVPSTIRPAMNL
jgi:hypothetical protein